MDHFTCYAQGYATKNKPAITVAQKLYNDCVLRFGFPLKIHHDQGGDFENRLLRELEKCAAWETPVPPLIIRKETDRLSDSTALC